MLKNKIAYYIRKIKIILHIRELEEEITKSGLFDKDYYLYHNPDIKKSIFSPLKHFILYGAYEYRSPSDKFDTAFYLQTYPDIAASGINPLLHYIRNGKSEKRLAKEPEPLPLTKRTDAALIFDHNLGGGTWTYVYNTLINASKSPKNLIILLTRYNPADDSYFVEVRKNTNIIEKVSYKKEIHFFKALSESDYTSIIVNNLASWPSTKNVLEWVSEYKKDNPTVSVEFKGHDYYSVCPSFTLQDYTHRYCGIRSDEEECNDCVHMCYGHMFLDRDNSEKFSVNNWRTMWDSFFTDTVDVFEVFSESSKKIFTQAYPVTASKMKLVPHEIPSFECFNIAILGHLSSYKGSEVVRQLCKFADDNHITDIQLHLFGWNVENVISPHLTETGAYQRHQLPEKLKKANIDLVFIPSTCPETFCYTAGEAIALGYPVACFNLGGQADQVRKSEKGIILYDDDPLYLYNMFKDVCKNLRTSTDSKNTDKSITEVNTIVLQDKASREFLDWMYKQRDDKSHFVPEAEDFITRTPDMPKIIAFYLPQFHDFEENVKWFGKGFSEWTNTSQTLPQFVGHRQPQIPIDVGYYTLDSTAVMHRQAELAKKYGISGFCVYYYWFSGAKLMEKPMQYLLKDKSLDFPFFFFWANEHWTRLWGNGANREVLHKMELLHGDAERFMEDALPYMRDPRYIKINNKPVLIIYKLKIFPKNDYLDFISTIQEIARKNGFDGIYLSGIIEEWMDPDRLYEIQSEYCLDALTEFSSVFGRTGWTFKENNSFDPAFKSYQYDVDDYVQNKKYLRTTDANVFAGLFPNWDNTPRRYNRGASILQNTPENYKNWLSDLIKWTKDNHPNKEEQLIFVNAWNEWAESAHLEPDTYYGYSYLQKTRESLEEAAIKKPIQNN